MGESLTSVTDEHVCRCFELTVREILAVEEGSRQFLRCVESWISKMAHEVIQAFDLCGRNDIDAVWQKWLSSQMLEVKKINLEPVNEPAIAASSAFADEVSPGLPAAAAAATAAFPGPAALVGLSVGAIYGGQVVYRNFFSGSYFQRSIALQLAEMLKDTALLGGHEIWDEAVEEMVQGIRAKAVKILEESLDSVHNAIAKSAESADIVRQKQTQLERATAAVKELEELFGRQPSSPNT